MSYKYLLSVIIPTKNRQQYAEKAIEQILSIDSSKIQIVIQDNSDKNILSKKLEKYINSNRIKYNYSNKILSFVDNFSEAISLADGEYICVIGDDDGILPDIIPITEWAKKNNIDAIVPKTNAVYIWPSKKPIIKNADYGYLCMSYINDKVYKCNPKKALEEVMSYGGQKYLYTDLVKLYHGVVKRDCMDKVKNITGHYFGGLSPDIYASFALSFLVDNAIRLDYPLTISGICNTSGSSDSATGKHTGKLEDAPHFRGHSSYNWCEEVPKFYSVETIWADSGLQALKELKAKDYVNKFNIAALDMYCEEKYSDFKELILDHERKNNVNRFNIIYEKIRLPYKDMLIKVGKRIIRKKKDVIKQYNISDILIAEQKIKQTLDELNINVNLILNSLDDLIGNISMYGEKNDRRS